MRAQVNPTGALALRLLALAVMSGECVGWVSGVSSGAHRLASGRAQSAQGLVQTGGGSSARSIRMVQTFAASSSNEGSSAGSRGGSGGSAAGNRGTSGAMKTCVEQFALDDALLSPAALARREALLEQSYEACREITSQFSKTFFMGTRLFPPEKARAVWAVYAWCRRTDDIVDKPRADRTSLRTELQQWQERLTSIWAGKPYDMIDLALADTVRKFPALPITPCASRP